MWHQETPLETAERQVRESEELIARQEALVRSLKEQGQRPMIYDAVVFLQSLRAEQRERVATLKRLRILE